MIGARSTQPRTPPVAQARRLDVLVIGADIADMREGEGDDLPGIGRVGQDLLIAGHRGVEADFADRDAGSARALALDHGAVGENEKRGRRLDAPRERTARATCAASAASASVVSFIFS